MVKVLARIFRAILDELDDESPRRVTEELKRIEENHLAHIYSRLGKVEGKVAILIGLSGTMLAAILGPIVKSLLGL